MLEFDRVFDILDRLLDPQGCPWDRKQTIMSLRKFILEEVYEAIEAIELDDNEKIKEELGDVAFILCFLIRLGEKEGRFKRADVLNGVSEKMIRRHPHVFADKKVKTVKQVWQNWEQIKKAEKNNKGRSILAGVPAILPGLYRAEKIQKKAARVGFDWEHAEGAWKKVREEIKEFQEAYKKKNISKKHLEEEMGDILFSLVNVSRKFNIDAETALRKTIEKFIKRFNYIEKKVEKDQKELSDCSLKELDKYWEDSKKYPSSQTPKYPNTQKFK